MTAYRLPISDDACAKARELLAEGVDPTTMLEFMRGDVVCLRGTVRAFTIRRLTTSNSGTPVHKVLTVEEMRAAGLPVNLLEGAATPIKATGERDG